MPINKESFTLQDTQWQEVTDLEPELRDLPFVPAAVMFPGRSDRKFGPEIYYAPNLPEEYRVAWDKLTDSEKESVLKFFRFIEEVTRATPALTNEYDPQP